MEYITVRGRKMKNIPVEELQFFQFWVENLMNEPRRAILDDEHDKYIDRLSKKYDMPFEDIQLQASFRRRKDVWKVLNMPHKEYLKFCERIRALPTENIEEFLTAYNKLLKETAEKYGLVVPE